MLLVGASRAGAQTNLIPMPRFKIGAFFPTNTSLNNAVGNTWLKLGADVNVPFSLIPFGSTRAGIDYVVNGSSNIVPITLIQTFQPSAGLKSPVYVGAGIGLWTGHIKGSGSSTKFGFRVLAGAELSRKMFLEVQYDIVDKLGGARADGVSVLVGTQF
jgi:hypothetical protein